jgi:hypothetical protein
MTDFQRNIRLLRFCYEICRGDTTTSCLNWIPWKILNNSCREKYGLGQNFLFNILPIALILAEIIRSLFRHWCHTQKSKVVPNYTSVSYGSEFFCERVCLRSNGSYSQAGTSTAHGTVHLSVEVGYRHITIFFWKWQFIRSDMLSYIFRRNLAIQIRINSSASSLLLKTLKIGTYKTEILSELWKSVMMMNHHIASETLFRRKVRQGLGD